MGEEKTTPFRALVVRRADGTNVTRAVEQLDEAELPEGGVTIAVQWSSLNYKDALAATGHPGVARSFPHVPGIDAAGEIVASDSPSLPVGLQVLVTGYELGAGQWGGWSETIRVPADWVIPLPDQLDAHRAMMLGTAGFTAAQLVRALQRHAIEPDAGPIAVTGATGGVGSLAICLLARLGYEVVASTGKSDSHTWLKQLGAAEVVSREAIENDARKPLAAARWAGGIDTVGGNTLASLLRATRPHGCIAACGMAGGHQLDSTVYPFILRGVALDGITSALCPDATRRQIWSDLAGQWQIPQLEQITREVTLETLEAPIESILQGMIRGRVVVRIRS